MVLTAAAGDLKIPAHLAIIMDGNGRWAEARALGRVLGHRQGAAAVRKVVENSVRYGVKILTLFAFSSENWKRPPAEVKALMELFALTLSNEGPRMHENNIRVKIAGGLERFSPGLQQAILNLEQLTAGNTAMTLNIAVNYGGRNDIVRAARALAQEAAAGRIKADEITEEIFRQKLYVTEDVDLLVRTGGEHRISNFLLYQLAYSEIYIDDVLWPDYDEEHLRKAFAYYSGRERRFGMTSAQIREGVREN